jgi:hypothetical protein
VLGVADLVYIEKRVVECVSTKVAIRVTLDRMRDNEQSRTE